MYIYIEREREKDPETVTHYIGNWASRVSCKFAVGFHLLGHRRVPGDPLDDL